MYVELINNTTLQGYPYIGAYAYVTINEYTINGHVLGGELYSVISRHLWIQIRIGNEIPVRLGHPMCL